MLLQLKVTDGPHKGDDLFEFSAPSIVRVGRDEKCHVPLPKDGRCSWFQLQFRILEDGCELSQQGQYETFVDEQLLDRHWLQEPVTIKFGYSEIQARVLPLASGAAPPQPISLPNLPPPNDLTHFRDFTTIDDWVYVESLGQGSAGWVCRMRHRLTGEEVALKVLKPSLDPLEWKRFMRERQVLEQMEHPHIARVYGGGEDDGAWYHLLEYIPGRNLRQLWMSPESLSAPEAVAIMIQVLDGLEHAHEHGILHRDIKPENIMVDDAGRVRLLDFGFGKIEAGPGNPAGEATHPNTVLGSLPFIYPPLFLDQTATRRSDVFSAAATLYWTLTGEYLYDFVNRNPREVVAEGKIIPLFHRLHRYPRLCAVVDRALGLGPEAPCETAREFQRLLSDPALLRSSRG